MRTGILTNGIVKARLKSQELTNLNSKREAFNLGEQQKTTEIKAIMNKINDNELKINQFSQVLKELEKQHLALGNSKFLKVELNISQKILDSQSEQQQHVALKLLKMETKYPKLIRTLWFKKKVNTLKVINTELIQHNKELENKLSKLKSAYEAALIGESAILSCNYKIGKLQSANQMLYGQFEKIKNRNS